MPPVSSSHVATVRRFNRFYTRQIGVLHAGHLGSPFSITEVRVLYELAHRDAPTATDLGAELGLDAGYLSRILRRFERMKLVARRASSSDKRRSHLRLTRAGRAAFAPLNNKASAEVASMLGRVAPPARRELLIGMDRIQRSLDTDTAAPAGRNVTLRRHRPGDMGWVVHRHGALYAKEYGYSDKFEALVARIVADFIDHLDPARERCWIAERDGQIVGSVFLVRKTDSVAKLRMLYLEPSARGLGLGRRLVDECIAFARKAGYEKITLWTQNSLQAARHIYQATGFVLKGSKRHSDFGPREMAETWELIFRE
jgi:DNA-binding MarR family transcriptional regulator/GNAT superfamily N-acetyltransferase